MDCHHHAAGRCGSCTLLEIPLPRQVADKDAHARSLIACPQWLPPVSGPEVGFRTKAKMAVGGTVDEPTLGILDASFDGVDLRDCGVQDPRLEPALEEIARFITTAALEPYDVAARRGELKHVLVTVSADGEFMARFVLRSTSAQARIVKHLPALLAAVPGLRVVTLNIQPEHKAVLEGEREIVLTDAARLPMALSTGVRLHLGPRSFFQTNTVVAEALYAHAREWVDELDPSSVWDLYCGVGGFGLHLAAPGRAVLGVEVSAEAIASARTSAAEAGLSDTTWVAADATAYVRGLPEDAAVPDVVVANPPRRGIGAELAGWLERSAVPSVLYSSCNAESLARDLAAMPSLRPVRAQVLDMFPHTRHYEVLTLLRRG